MKLEISKPDHPDALPLLDSLSAELKRITGADGRASFASWSDHPRAAFVLARHDGLAVGCGAIRPFDDESAELKRMYASRPGCGIGTLLLDGLEALARDFAYRRILLETRRCNEAACAFYLAKGYRPRENYGTYQGRPECVCFEKTIAH